MKGGGDRAACAGADYRGAERVWQKRVREFAE